MHGGVDGWVTREVNLMGGCTAGVPEGMGAWMGCMAGVDKLCCFWMQRLPFETQHRRPFFLCDRWMVRGGQQTWLGVA